MSLTETFETHPGTDNTYATIVESGNSLDPDFTVSSIGVQPVGWGVYCLQVTLGATLTGAQYSIQLPVNLAGAVTQFSIVPASLGSADGTGFTCMILKQEGELGDPSNVWRLYIWRTGANYHFRLFLGVGVLSIIHDWPRAGTLSAGTMYNHEIWYDIQSRRYRWLVNGVEQAAGVIPSTVGFGTSIEYLVLGSSASSTGKNSIYLLDAIKLIDLAARS